MPGAECRRGVGWVRREGGGIQFTGAGSTAGVVGGAVLGLRVDCVGVDSRADGSRAAMLKIIVRRFRSKGASAGKLHVARG